MPNSFDLSRIERRLQLIYGERVNDSAERIGQLLSLYAPIMESTRADTGSFDESSSILITYGDQVADAQPGTIRALDELLERVGLDRVLSHVHFLPFFPYSSDDGFSVIDYRRLDQVHGTWDDVQGLSRRYGLMFDLVLNHISAKVNGSPTI